jgi:hypothetical protein
MIEKVDLNGTYAYKNFIDEGTKQILLNWADTNYESFVVNPISVGRRYKIVLSEDPIYELVSNIKNKIIELEGITDWKEEPM